MTIFGLSVGAALSWLLAFAFLGAGLVNAVGSEGIRGDFVRWGYPRWWNVVTGALELLVAALIVTPSARVVGLGLGAAICVAAAATVVRHRDYGHLAPVSVLTGLVFAVALLIG